MRRGVAAVLVVAVLIAIVAGSVYGLTRPGASQPVALEPSPTAPPPTSRPAASPTPDRWPAAGPGGYALAPVESDATGMALGSPLLLTTPRDLETAAVERELKVEPATPFSVQRADAGRYQIAFTRALNPGTVYRLTLGPEGADSPSWAFQTTTTFAVSSTLPRDRVTGVPLDTGIEMVLSLGGLDDPAPFFQIEPAVEGRLEIHDRTIAFVPAHLEPGTLYTVTLRAGYGVAGAGQARLSRDVVFQFETSASPPVRQAYFAVSRSWQEASPGEPPLIAVTRDRSLRQAAVTAYAYGSLDAFLAAVRAREAVPRWAAFSYAQYQVPTEGLARVASFTGPFEESEPDGPPVDFIRFPSPLPAGFYVVTLEAGGQTRSTWLQVTPVAIYAVASSTTSLVWANEVTTGGPLDGAIIRLAGGPELGRTGADGTASFSTPAELKAPAATSRTSLLTVTAGDRVAVVPLGGDGRFTSSAFDEVLGVPAFFPPYGGDESYWRYLFLDRPVYLPTDDLRFWGLVRPRAGAPTAALRADLVPAVDSQSPDARPLVQTTVPANAEGIFEGSFALNNLRPGWYAVRIWAGDHPVAWEEVEVKAYVKPAYRLTVTPERRGVFAGTPIRFTVSAAFFDGTPVPDLSLTYAGDAQGTGRTDALGQLVVTVPPRQPSGDASIWPVNLFVTPASSEKTEISANGNVLVFRGAIALDATTRREGGKTVLQARASQVELQRLHASQADPWSDYRGAAAAGQSVRARVTEVKWVPTAIGEYYDFISKQTLKRYRYDRQTAPAGAFTLVTDAEGKAEQVLDLPEGQYEVRLETTDDSGRLTVQMAYAYGKGPGTRPGGTYSLEDVAGQHPYRAGDQVDLAFRSAGRPLAAGGPVRYLYLQARLGLLEHHLDTDPTYRFTFGNAHVPNVNVYAVAFNGATYIPAGGPVRVVADVEPRRLQVQIDLDRERYAPRQEARVSVRVADGEGRPVQAQVNLSVVDEAVFALQPRSVRPLEALYQPLRSGITGSYASHQYPKAEIVPGGLGGGGDTAEAVRGRESSQRPRHEFLDVAYFGTVRTGADGGGEVRVHLPDNLTSWRITAQAVTADLKAGSAMGSAPVGLPFFVDTTLAGQYLVGEKPVLLLRAFGQSLPAGRPVQFTVAAPSLGAPELAAAGEAYRTTPISLPALTAGTHDLTIAARAEGMSDSVIEKLRVVPSRLLRGEARYLEVGAGTSVPGGTDGRTTVTVLDRGRAALYPALLRLGWRAGDRLDQRLARTLAGALQEKYFEEGPAEAGFEASTYQGENGGIALLPLSSAEVGLTARAAAAGASYFDRAGLRDYLTSALQRGDIAREERVMALWGLASLREPVLLTVQRLAGGPDLTALERLYLALAAGELGDRELATSLYQRVLGETGVERSPLLYLNVSGRPEEVLRATALAAVAGARLGDRRAPALFAYAADQGSDETVVDLELALYATRVLPTLSADPVRFAYTIDGKRQEQALDRGHGFRLDLSAEELRTLRLEALSGQVGAVSQFEAPAAASGADSSVAIGREYRVGGRPTTSFAEGDLVEVRLSYRVSASAPAGCYQVTDLLPSGLRPVLQPWVYGAAIADQAWYPYAVDNQRVSFCVGQGAKEPIIYYARVVAPGEYLAEPALIQSMQSPGVFSLSERTTVTVR